MKIKNTDYIVIQAPMTTALKLSGNSLIVFALIHGFSKDGIHHFTGSIDYIAEWTNISRRSVIEILKKLTNDGYISKNEIIKNGVRFCEYWTNYDASTTNFTGSEETAPPVQKLHGGSEETSRGVVKKLHGGSEETSPNNILNNIQDNINYNIECDTRARMSDVKLEEPKIIDGEVVRVVEEYEFIFKDIQTFYERKLNSFYTPSGNDTQHAKELAEKFKILKDTTPRYDNCGYETAFKFFLIDAYTIADEWQKNHFDIKMLNTQFNTIKNSMKNGKERPNTKEQQQSKREELRNAMRERLERRGIDITKRENL